jgi:hypothetical protein
MLCCLFSIRVPLPETNDNILKQHSNDISIAVIGSIVHHYYGKCNPTITDPISDFFDHKTDYCSNINKSKTDHLCFSISLLDKSLSFSQAIQLYS